MKSKKAIKPHKKMNSPLASNVSVFTDFFGRYRGIKASTKMDAVAISRIPMHIGIDIPANTRLLRL